MQRKIKLFKSGSIFIPLLGIGACLAAQPAAYVSALNAPTQTPTGPFVQSVAPLPTLTRFCTPTPPTDTTTSHAEANFAGLSQADSPLKIVPADTSGSVGEHAFGEIINSAIGFFDKQTGQPLCPAQSAAQMWAGTPCSVAVSDAVLKYDSLAHRWIVSRPGGKNGGTSGTQCIAVSAGEDPTGAWYRYQFPISIPGISAVGDYPKLSIWSNSYAYSARARSTTNPGDPNSMLLGDYIVAFDRHAMLDNKPASVVEFLVPQTPTSGEESDQFYFLPASDEGSTVPPASLDIPYVERFEGTSSQLATWDLRVRWANPSQAQFTQTGLVNVAPYTNDIPPVTQPAINGVAAQALSPSSNVIMQPLIYRRIDGHQSIFGALTTAVSTTRGVHSGIQWFELRKDPAGTWRLFQEGTYAPADGNDRWLPSLSANEQGDMGLVFNVSGPNLYPSLHYTSRSARDPRGTLRPEQTLIDGNGSQVAKSTCNPDDTGQVVCAFGDYSQASIDPANSCLFWMAGEYYASQAQADQTQFSTRIGSFHLPACRE